MNDQQSENAKARIEAVFDAIHSTWTYYYLLRGLHEGANSHPDVLESLPELFSELWRALFWALFATVGTTIDRTPKTNSIPNTLKMIKAYSGKGSDPAKRMKELEAKLYQEGGPASRLEAWRHSVVAHNTMKGREAGFVENEKMNLDEVEASIDEISGILNEASKIAINARYDVKTPTEVYAEHGKSLFERIAA